mgnify:CR=1 FL=1
MQKAQRLHNVLNVVYYILFTFYSTDKRSILINGSVSNESCNDERSRRKVGHIRTVHIAILQHRMHTGRGKNGKHMAYPQRRRKAQRRAQKGGKRMNRLLLLEDDLSLIDGLSYSLKKQRVEIDIARTVNEASNLWSDGKYDLLILDVSLPDGSGFDVCKKVRQVSKVPIIFLTASGEEVSMIMGLDVGCDDYITKPFKLGV